MKKEELIREKNSADLLSVLSKGIGISSTMLILIIRLACGINIDNIESGMIDYANKDKMQEFNEYIAKKNNVCYEEVINGNMTSKAYLESLADIDYIEEFVDFASNHRDEEFREKVELNNQRIEMNKFFRDGYSLTGIAGLVLGYIGARNAKKTKRKIEDDLIDLELFGEDELEK